MCSQCGTQPNQRVRQGLQPAKHRRESLEAGGQEQWGHANGRKGATRCRRGKQTPTPDRAKQSPEGQRASNQG